MASQLLVSTTSEHGWSPSVGLDGYRPSWEWLEHLVGMETTANTPSPNTSTRESGICAVITLSELAAELGVSVQTLYDLRSQGRGPCGFRVGRELRFRVTEVNHWLEQLEDDDAARHPREVR